MGLGETQRPSRGDPNPPSESNTYRPQFSFTANLISHFTEKCIKEAEYRDFVTNFDAYLRTSAETEGLIAIGILAIPGSSIRQFGSHLSGLQIDGVSLWSGATQLDYMDYLDFDLEWKNLTAPIKDPISEDGASTRNNVIPGFMVPFTTNDYPNPEDLLTALNDKEAREEITLTLKESEYWGMITTEELREELRREELKKLHYNLANKEITREITRKLQEDSLSRTTRSLLANP